ncbi:hypothetical protein ACHAXT_001075 [Thalassiosira profunda]
MTLPRPLFAVLCAALVLQGSYGFVACPRRAAVAASSLSLLDASEGADDAGGIQLVSLAALGDDHDAVGDAMAKSLAAWLDEEWMPQEVHVRMGVSVKNTYVACRTKGMDDVAAIMTEVTDDLYKSWEQYNADAFVNAWDIGNYIADYLIAKSGSETCGCSTKIVE